jgi:hypothetical protein
MKNSSYQKRTQKDYTVQFKLSVVEEVEKEHLITSRSGLEIGSVIQYRPPGKHKASESFYLGSLFSFAHNLHIKCATMKL